MNQKTPRAIEKIVKPKKPEALDVGVTTIRVKYSPEVEARRGNDY